MTAAATSAQSIFKVVPSPNANPNNGLFAVSASAPSDIWAVGQSAIHFDGTEWTAFPLPIVHSGSLAAMQGVADISPTEAWAVGNSPSGALIEQWNGSAWTQVSQTFPPNSQSYLYALAKVSGSDLWAVGTLITNGLGSFLFDHWNGTAWTPTTIPTNNAILIGAAADAPNDVWAVGYSGFLGSDSKTLIYHYNGSSWKPMASPSVGAADELYAVSALAPNDVWAVGTSIAVEHDPTLTLIEHYDGTSWSVLPSPNVGPASSNQSNRLFGVSALASNDVWAFGSYFDANGSGFQFTLVQHWDGAAWTIVPSPSPNPSGFISDVLFGGVSTGPRNFWIVGSQDTAAPNKPITGTLALHTTTADENQ